MSMILPPEDLASWLETDITPQLTLIADLVGDMVEEAWLDPVDPVPAWVKALALGVAVRAAANPKGLTSWTVSWDDITRTERVESGGGQVGIFLTDDETSLLAGNVPGSRVAGTIHTPFRGESCSL